MPAPSPIAISPVIIQMDGDRTTLLRRGTAESRPLPDGSTDAEIHVAAQAWAAELAAPPALRE